MTDYSKRKVLIFYTGGTMGMTRYPLIPGTLDNLRKNVPEADQLPYQITWKEFKDSGRFIDSSNTKPSFYNNLARELGTNYDLYDGFVVVMGTDTMEDTAGYTSYLLEGLKKPVVFTGSSEPAESEEFKEKNNLLNAINIAGRSGYDIPLIPESVIYFNNKIIRGVCSHKFRAQGFDAFDYPGMNPYPLLGKITDSGEITINENLLLPQNNSKLKINQLDKSVIIDELGLNPIYNSNPIFERLLRNKMGGTHYYYTK